MDRIEKTEALVLLLQAELAELRAAGIRLAGVEPGDVEALLAAQSGLELRQVA